MTDRDTSQDTQDTDAAEAAAQAVDAAGEATAPVEVESPASTESSDNAESPASTESSASPESSDSTESPASPESPNSTESPADTEAPASAKSPDSAEAPASTESPNSTESPADTEAPASAKSPDSAEAPARTGSPDSAESPAGTEAPASTGSSDSAESPADTEPPASEEPSKAPTSADPVAPDAPVIEDAPATDAKPVEQDATPAEQDATPAEQDATPAEQNATPAAQHHEPVPPPTAAMPHTQPPTAVPAAPVAAAPVAEASANPGKWGRVDPDGTVYVKTTDGERAVGSWQAGEPAEGLAHYARRFDDVRTEVELLAARLAAGSGDPKHTLTNAKHIKESLAEAPLVGDLAGLAARIDHVLERAQQAVESVKHARDEARGQALARKQALVEEVEQIAESSTQWKSAGDRLRAILDEWKTIKGVDRKTDDQMWKRFSKARDTFNRRRGSHFADLDRQRGAAKERKQELVQLAEEISDSEDWGPTAARYRELMTEWKAAGRAPKEADDALWQQFRAAQDKFFSRRASVFNERDAELVENAKRKEGLLAEAEKINPAADLDAARAHLHRIQEKWDEVGKVPRDRIRELEGKLRAIEEKVRNAADAQWRRTDPEAEARAAQFRERVAQFEAQAAKARAAGDKRRAEQAEAQAAQWREWLAAAENAVASR
jgi:uncharacterized protein DUF349